ncbi:MAG: cell division protein ZapE [Alphaproteobacteria bacterium]|nr:cell division protein ZapE [Alphaproteobacteria bacterium]
MAAYRAKVASGELKADPMQRLSAEKLELLSRALRGYSPQRGERKGLLGRIGFRPKKRDEDDRPPPSGLYLFGGVGRGKSMLMDLFSENVDVEHTLRVHHHVFMKRVHDRLHHYRSTNKSKKVDVIDLVADEIAAEAWLLCFDEFDVNDIADAMIIARLFEALFDRGVVVVATSNKAPDQLYRNGLHRDRFLPFIDILKARVDILEMDSGYDYRRDRDRDEEVYFSPLGPETVAALDHVFKRLTGENFGPPSYLRIYGRSIAVPQSIKSVARFAFDDLCAKPLGANDYLEIAGAFHTVLLSDIPLLGPENRNEARRFIHLIDALYENRNRVYFSAAAEPDKLYPTGDGSFEFRRTASRLMEMRSADYLKLSCDAA